MEKKDLFTQMHQVEEQVGHVHQLIGALKQEIVQLVEQNKRLSIENQQLRKLLRRDEAVSSVQQPEQGDKSDKATQAVGEGYDNLARLYLEGFHICNVHYGHFRTEKDCLFCLSFLNK